MGRRIRQPRIGPRQKVEIGRADTPQFRVAGSSGNFTAAPRPLLHPEALLEAAANAGHVMGGRSMKLLAGNSNPRLADDIAAVLDVPLTKANIRRFADNEVFVAIEENVRGEDVFVLQSTSYPANDNLMELLICIDALTRASARRITAVMPYFGYARQDRKTGGPHADLGQARRQPDHPRRRRPGADDGYALGPDPGLLRYPDRQFAADAADGHRHPPARTQDRRTDDRLAGRRRRVTRPEPGRAAERRSRHRRQAAIRTGRLRGDEHHRRGEGPALHPVRRHRRFGRHPCATPPKPW